MKVNIGGTVEDVKLVEDIRKTVRFYMERIRRAKNFDSQRGIEDAFVTWIFSQIRKARK